MAPLQVWVMMYVSIIECDVVNVVVCLSFIPFFIMILTFSLLFFLHMTKGIGKCYTKHLKTKSITSNLCLRHSFNNNFFRRIGININNLIISCCITQFFKFTSLLEQGATKLFLKQ